MVKQVDKGIEDRWGAAAVGLLVWGDRAEIPAIAGAHHSNFLRINEPGLDHPGSGGDNVIQVSAAHVEAAGGPIFLAIACGPAVIRHDHKEALVRRILHASDEGAPNLDGAAAMHGD